MAELRRVGTRELKNKLSEYMRRVKAGETIIVTERGRPIGQIVPLKPTLEKRLQAMVDAGLAEWNVQKLKPHKPAAINRGKKLVSDLVGEDRNVDYLPFAKRAAALAWEHGLRGYDAMHFASALTWQETLDTSVTLATYDRELWSVAKKVGMDVWPSNIKQG